MLVVTDVPKMIRQRLGEQPRAGNGVVLLEPLARPDGLLHLLGHVGKYVAFAQGFQHSIDHLGACGRVERHVCDGFCE